MQAALNGTGIGQSRSFDTTTQRQCGLKLTTPVVSLLEAGKDASLLLNEREMKLLLYHPFSASLESYSLADRAVVTSW